MEKIYLSTNVEKLLDPFVDVGNLLIIDNDPFECSSQHSAENEERILERTRNNAQYLLNKVWELDRQRIEDAVVAKLPPVIFRLPREKVLPKRRQLTKWEQYAQAKGIKKRNKTSKVYNSVTKEWNPVYGYRHTQNNVKDWLIEIPDHKDPMVDYFGELEDAKKERMHKNELQRLRNIGRQRNLPDFCAPLGVTMDFQDRSKHDLVNQINRARFSTASFGEFQPGLRNEKAPKKQEVTRKFEPNEARVVNEKKRYLQILDRMYAKKPKIDENKLPANKQQVDVSSRENSSKFHCKKKKSYQKSAVHRQQYFQNKVKAGKKNKKGTRRKR